MSPDNFALVILIVSIIGIISASIWTYFDKSDINVFWKIVEFPINYIWKSYLVAYKTLQKPELKVLRWAWMSIYWTAFCICAIIRYTFQGIYYLIRLCICKWFGVFIPKRVKIGWKKLPGLEFMKQDITYLIVMILTTYIAFIFCLSAFGDAIIMFTIFALAISFALSTYSIMLYRTFNEILKLIFEVTYMDK
jgi:hypothetical protein